jgi:hypothetical protein
VSWAFQRRVRARPREPSKPIGTAAAVWAPRGPLPDWLGGSPERQPAFAGSQRSLIPDVVLERSDVTVVLDAKYKRHLEEIERSGWRGVEDELREHHRDDPMQVLAYSTMFSSARVVARTLAPLLAGA